MLCQLVGSLAQSLHSRRPRPHGCLSVCRPRSCPLGLPTVKPRVSQRVAYLSQLFCCIVCTVHTLTIDNYAYTRYV